MRGIRTKSWFSLIAVAAGVCLTAVWALIGLIGSIIGYPVDQFVDVLVGVFLFCFCVAGVPWGWNVFWPFWRNCIGGLRFNILPISGAWFVVSLLVDAVVFVAKILILPALCIGLGWIFMLIHIPVIVENVAA